jgi:hypothetical protein
MVLGLGLISLFIAIIWLETVKAFSLDNLFLSLRINSQNLSVVKPSVTKIIFLYVSRSSSLSFVVVAAAVNVAATDLFDRLAIRYAY